MNEKNAEKYSEVIEELLTGSFNIVPCDSLVAGVTLKVIEQWPQLSSDKLLGILKEEGVEEANADNIEEFFDELYNGIINLDEEEASC